MNLLLKPLVIFEIQFFRPKMMRLGIFKGGRDYPAILFYIYMYYIYMHIYIYIYIYTMWVGINPFTSDFHAHRVGCWTCSSLGILRPRGLRRVSGCFNGIFSMGNSDKFRIYIIYNIYSIYIYGNGESIFIINDMDFSMAMLNHWGEWSGWIPTFRGTLSFVRGTQSYTHIFW